MRDKKGWPSIPRSVSGATLNLDRNMRIVVFLVTSALLTGCAGSSQYGPMSTVSGTPSSKVSLVNSTELPSPAGAELEESRPYLIGPFDKLTIDVYGIQELSQREFQADATGRISFPMLGSVEAAGKTPAELEKVIAEGLRQGFVRNPQVTVNLKETVSRVITVDGEVKEPGLYPVVGRMTLIRAIATAKGLSEFGRQENVIVFRTVRGQRYAALYNLKAIRRGVYDDPELFANDTVVVDDSQARRFFKDALQVLPLMITPIIYAIR